MMCRMRAHTSLNLSRLESVGIGWFSDSVNRTLSLSRRHRRVKIQSLATPVVLESTFRREVEIQC